jgi:hypothetical protein
MTTKVKALPAKSNIDELRIKGEEGKSEKRQIAEAGLSESILNSVTARKFNRVTIGETDLNETIHAMKEKIAKVNNGDLSTLEATLTAQTVSLNAIFNEMARRAAANMGEYMSATETYMRLALKAQSQCARTVEVISNMKNPPIVYAKQMNVANGNQQVNNVANASIPSHTEKTINLHSELLEVNNGSKKMDGRTAKATITKDKAMATVDKVYRRKNC